MGDVDLRLLERQWQAGRQQSGFILGITYLKGRKGINVDKGKGLAYLRASARQGYLRSAIYLSFYFAGIWGPESTRRCAAARYWDLRFRLILKHRGNQGDWWARDQYLGHIDQLKKGSHPWLYADLDDNEQTIPAYVKAARKQLQFREQWKLSEQQHERWDPRPHQ